MNEKIKEKVSLVSLGCPKNLVDAEVMLGYLSRDDYEVTTDEIAANKGNPLPPQNHHQHSTSQGKIRWRKIL